MTAEWNQVIRALLGSWPGTMAAWGADAIEAYAEEIEARGVTVDGALRAIRSWPAGSDFPPSAPNLAAEARKDPGAPDFAEAVPLLGDVLRAGAWVRPDACPLGACDGSGFLVDEAENTATACRCRPKPGDRDAAAMECAAESHPRIAMFVRFVGLDYLRQCNPLDPEWGAANRRRLEGDWQRFLEASDGREVAALVSGRRSGELGRWWLKARRELEAGERA